MSYIVDPYEMIPPLSYSIQAKGTLLRLSLVPPYASESTVSIPILDGQYTAEVRYSGKEVLVKISQFDKLADDIPSQLRFPFIE